MKIGSLVLLGVALMLLVGSAGAGVYDTYTCTGVCVFDLPTEFLDGLAPMVEAESGLPFVVLAGRQDQGTIDLFLYGILNDPEFGLLPDGTWEFPYRILMSAEPVVTVIGLGETTVYLTTTDSEQPGDELPGGEPTIVEAPILHQSGHSLLTRYSEAHDR